MQEMKSLDASIGLLCVQENPTKRPLMATVALMLDSYSVTFSVPRRPASLLRGRVTSNRPRNELSSNHCSTTLIPLSTNTAPQQ